MKISAKFKHANFNTHIENSNYRKKWITFNNYNWLYMIPVNKFDTLLAGCTGSSIPWLCLLLWNNINMHFTCFILSRYFKKFRRLKTKIKLRTLELQNLMSFFIFAYRNHKNKPPRNTLLPKSSIKRLYQFPCLSVRCYLSRGFSLTFWLIDIFDFDLGFSSSAKSWWCCRGGELIWKRWGSLSEKK